MYYLRRSTQIQGSGSSHVFCKKGLQKTSKFINVVYYTVTNGRDTEEVARSAFDSNVWKYEHLGLYPGMYNRIFAGTDGKKYAIRRFRTQAKKWPIEMLRISDGEIRVCNEQFIKEFLDEYYTDVVVS